MGHCLRRIRRANYYAQVIVEIISVYSSMYLKETKGKSIHVTYDNETVRRC
jgi:hypothetical protein